MNFAYQIESYDDKHQGTQVSAAEYAALAGLACMDGEVDNLPNLCAMNVGQAPPALTFVNALTSVPYELQPLEFVGTRPDPRR